MKIGDLVKWHSYLHDPFMNKRPLEITGIVMKKRGKKLWLIPFWADHFGKIFLRAVTGNRLPVKERDCVLLSTGYDHCSGSSPPSPGCYGHCSGSTPPPGG